MKNAASILGLLLMVAGLFGLFFTHSLFGHHPLFIAIQIAACLLMIAARLTFGLRSFHASANPTSGGVVSTGPYAYWRHPIYSAVIYFIWAGALDHGGWGPVVWAALATAGAVVRMLCEEQMLVVRYPDYRAYMARTRRVIPFVF
jgi:protein-S-isoprenylcysteine O-methyltransferase Ste14